MNNIEFEIWGRNLNLEIIFDCFENEEISEVQNETLDKFLEVQEDIFEKSFHLIEKYCVKKNFINQDTKFDNIFKFVIPKSIYIKRSVTKQRICGILCDFKFDIEHGLCVYIVNEKVQVIGIQDIIL